MKTLEELKISPAPWRIVDSYQFPEGGEWVSVIQASNKKTVSVPTFYNARLIAAAPELYKWLAFAVEYYKCETRSCDKCPNGKCWIVDATAALAKAAGEEVGDGQSS